MGNCGCHAGLVMEDPTISPLGRRHYSCSCCGCSGCRVSFAALFARGATVRGLNSLPLVRKNSVQTTVVQLAYVYAVELVYSQRVSHFVLCQSSYR